MPTVLVVGMATLDFVMEVATIPQQAVKYRANAASLALGGNAAKAAVAIKKLGGNPVLVAPIGADAIGELIKQECTRYDISNDYMLAAKNSCSAYSNVCVDAGGERQIVNFRGDNLVSEFNFADLDINVDAMLVDTRRPQLALAALEFAQQQNIPGVLDAEPPIPENLLHAASHVAFSKQGLFSVADSDDLETALCAVAKQVPGFVCVTDGAAGCYFVADSFVNIPARQVTAIDTLGAGDVWHGALALQLANGSKIIDALSFANATGAWFCSQQGDASYPTLSQVEELLTQ